MRLLSRRRTLGIVVTLVVFLLLVAIPVGATHSPVGGCQFKGTLTWSRVGDADYRLLLKGNAVSPSCGEFFHTSAPLSVRATGSADHVGRCSTETLPGGGPWPTMDGVSMSGKIYSPSTAVTYQRFYLSLANVSAQPFPGPTPLNFFYFTPDYIPGIPAGMVRLSTRIFGNCPPAGSPTARATFDFIPFL